MYPGPYFAGRLGTAQRTGAVATREWHAIAYSDAHANSQPNTDAHANTYSETDTDSYTQWRRRKLFCDVERLPDLHRGPYCQS